MVFDNDVRFIGFEDAMEYCMKLSTKEFAKYSKLAERMDTPTAISYNNVFFNMPEHLASSICDNMRVDQGSCLADYHQRRDIVRNIAQAVIYNRGIDCLQGSPMQITYDKEGKPLGDAADLTNQVIDGMEMICAGFGEHDSFEIDETKVEFSPMTKEKIVVSKDGAKSMSYKPAPVERTFIQ